MEKKLNTWAGSGQPIRYQGDVKSGTAITYGDNNHAYISSDNYRRMLEEFQGKEVNIGTSRTKPPIGSLGEWLQANVSKTAYASYVGPILINEGYATKNKSLIRFKKLIQAEI